MVGKLLCVGDALHASSTLAPGFEIHNAPTAAACLSALERRRFDLVLIAFALPDASGCALRERLRARSDLASTPILVTAESEPSSEGSPTPRTALRELQRMLETAEAIAHLGSFRSSPGGEWPYVWSAENYRIHGVEEGVVITPELFMDLVHPGDRRRFLDIISAPRSGGTIHEIAYRIVRPDGGVRWLHVLTRLTYDSHGALLRIDGTTQDVTERRQAEHERDRFFELSHDLLGVFAFDEKLRRTSPSWSRATGFTAEELHRMSMADRVHTDDLAVTRGALERLRNGEPVMHFENRIRCKDGGYRSIEWTVVAAADEQRAYAVGRDVTAHKSLESQLRQAQKMEAIGQLAGGIAHDFNNMLSVILGVGQILRQEISEGDPLRADVSEIIAAAERAATLTRQLLAFSRKQVLKPRATDLSALVREMEGMLRRLIGEDVELSMVLAPQAGPVLADPGQLEQVILNLAVNARDAMPGGGRLTIETRTVQVSQEYAEAHLGLQSGAYALLLVSDNGEGMTPAVRERAFEPFFTTKEPGRGTGLGLSTVHGIVAQSEGHVWIYSEPGHGTTFKIHLPLHEGASAPAPQPPAAVGGGKGERILLVEDEPLVRQFTRRALTRAGYRVIEAANGGEALLIVESHEGPLDLLVTDVVMPRMSGPALAERLQRLRPGLRTLFMSGYSQAALGDGRPLPRDVDLVEKPITLEALARKVREVLDR